MQSSDQNATQNRKVQENSRGDLRLHRRRREKLLLFSAPIAALPPHIPPMIPVRYRSFWGNARWHGGHFQLALPLSPCSLLPPRLFPCWRSCYFRCSGRDQQFCCWVATSMHARDEIRSVIREVTNHSLTDFIYFSNFWNSQSFFPAMCNSSCVAPFSSLFEEETRETIKLLVFA